MQQVFLQCQAKRSSNWNPSCSSSSGRDEIKKVRRAVTALPKMEGGIGVPFPCIYGFGGRARDAALRNGDDWARMLVEDVRETAATRTGFLPEVAWAFPEK